MPEIFSGHCELWMAKINIDYYIRPCVNDCVGLKNRQNTK
uniref:Uncharacterized protein n=1 Tax=Myoviridae sp. ctGBP5 TaxID=2825071 RepID=A0A8S5PBL2_9CAUD|nr:MAG TPA: hypothetical protein [Myoviridae sp. ctGBP5]